MSFPDKEQRKKCWDARDKYWECLDSQNIKDSSQKPLAYLKTRMDEILEILLCANETKQEIKVEILQVLKI